MNGTDSELVIEAIVLECLYRFLAISLFLTQFVQVLSQVWLTARYTESQDAAPKLGSSDV